mmetsp:Transcript_14659/g.24402  ORF Transcript_14659/g.24402 Transcript_14659/m.24402 type:complete len:305 (-) Transcript_14659:121-1035(-)
MRDKSYLGMPQQPMKDILTRSCERQATTISLFSREPPSDLQTTMRPIIHALFDGSTATPSSLQQGYASKKSPTMRTRSKKQFEFIIHTYELGERCAADKLSPEGAAELMSVVGTNNVVSLYPNDAYLIQAVTADNTPLFALHERLDDYALKALLNKQGHLVAKQARATATAKAVPLEGRDPKPMKKAEIASELQRLRVDYPEKSKVGELRSSLENARLLQMNNAVPTEGSNQDENDGDDESEYDEEEDADDEDNNNHDKKPLFSIPMCDDLAELGIEDQENEEGYSISECFLTNYFEEHTTENE